MRRGRGGQYELLLIPSPLSPNNNTDTSKKTHGFGISLHSVRQSIFTGREKLDHSDRTFGSLYTVWFFIVECCYLWINWDFAQKVIGTIPHGTHATPKFKSKTRFVFFAKQLVNPCKKFDRPSLSGTPSGLFCCIIKSHFHAQRVTQSLW